MKAIVRDRYGPPDVLRFEDVPKPTPAENECLVRVHAAGINKGDWEMLIDSPLWVRLFGFGLTRPKARIPGSNFSGRIESVGQAVSRFEVGDEICGDLLQHGLGAFAEYVCVPEGASIVRKPAGVSFEEAASVPESGLIALQAIRNKGRLEAGQKILINGAGGGAGTFAIQLARSLGAEVTAVDSAEKLELMRSLGADHVIDYAQEDFAQHDKQYDLILDVVGVRALETWRRLLGPQGLYVTAGGTVGYIIKTLLYGVWTSFRSDKRIGVLGVSFNSEDLDTVIELVESGRVAATIDRTYPLRDVPEALRYLGAGHSKGKLVISI